MKYLQIPTEIELEWNRLKKDNNVFHELTDPSAFAKNTLKITPFKYQHYILRKFKDESNIKNDRIIICKSRQIGISICLAILSIWFAAFNKANNGKGTGIHNNTKVGIISKSDNQSKKLMRDIHNLIWNADAALQELVMKDHKNPLNKSEIYFKNGLIKCFPPTDACRGETFDLLVIDEAAFVDGDIFKDAMVPTISAVGGKIILSSTPNGQKGFFYETFDPFDTRETHEYERIWFWWEMCENEVQRRVILEHRKHTRETGDTKSFDQEYNALFTVDQEAFFESQDIEKNIDSNLSEVFESKEPVCIGLDYGMTQAETCITVTTKRNNTVILLYQFAQTNLDDNLLTDPTWDNSIQSLSKRYPNIIKVVVDDCAQGHRTNTELETLGYPVLKFDWRSDRHAGERNRGYYRFRAALKQYKIKYPNIPKLTSQMNSLQEIRMEINTRIKAPENYLDDRCDSFMMAAYPFITEDETSFSSVLVDYQIEEKKRKENRFYDPEWEILKKQAKMEETRWTK